MRPFVAGVIQYHSVGNTTTNLSKDSVNVADQSDATTGTEAESTFVAAGNVRKIGFG